MSVFMYAAIDPAFSESAAAVSSAVACLVTARGSVTIQYCVAASRPLPYLASLVWSRVGPAHQCNDGVGSARDTGSADEGERDPEGVFPLLGGSRDELARVLTVVAATTVVVVLDDKQAYVPLSECVRQRTLAGGIRP